MGELTDKVAIITGGAGGIGRATAARFVRAGARVLLVDRDAQALEDARAAIDERVSVHVADVTVEHDTVRFVEAAIERFGGVDVLFANAGTEGVVAPLTEQREPDFARVMDVNVKGVWLGIKHAAPAIAARGGGAIVVTSSVAGLVGSRGLGPYAASKHAVVGLVKSAAIELAARGIRVNAVNPGPVDNRMMRSIEAQSRPGHEDDVRRVNAAQTPMGRYVTSEEVAEAVLFLASDTSRMITGTTLAVDGGFLAR